ncbi:MAG TPA: histidine kinase [Bacteroidia bacterium]|nr:histidine kinase [Bacteroidia bacterium]
MTKITLSKQEVYRHIGMWVFLLAFIPIGQAITGPLISQAVFSIITIINYGIPYYILLLIVFPFFYDQNKALFCLLYIATITIFFLIDYLNLRIIVPALGGYRFRVDNSMPHFIRGTFLHFLYLAIPASGAYMNKKIQKQTQDRVQKEKDILTKELDFLSNQFHSHLTFNFLNFCYMKLLASSSKAADTLTIFSDMLHYSLTIKQEEHIQLSKEIEYIENFITIQKCLTNNVYVDFKYFGDIEQKTILPGILSVFIENAFKHGILNDPNNPMNISIEVNDGILIFRVKNKKSTKNHFLFTGIGLENIKQVLRIFYKEVHNLTINSDDINYVSELKLKLNTMPQ